MPPTLQLEAILTALLPEQYQDRAGEIQPIPMGSAPLKFAPDGTVAWNEIWTTFCDLALAGGPPHKGTLLEPGSPSDIAAHQHQYDQIEAEICRGITLVTALPANPAPTPGWIRINTPTPAMASWLLRAITLENVAVRSLEIATLDLPAAPHFRLEKEVKNVITVIAKTHHYWQNHIPLAQKQLIASTLATLDRESPLIQPSPEADRAQAAATLQQITGLTLTPHEYPGWQGLQMPDVPTAIRTMRLLLASNVLARREGTTLFVPLAPQPEIVATRLAAIL